MSYTTKQQKESPLLRRKELVGEIVYESKTTPKKEDVAKMISQNLKVDVETVAVKFIKPIFGQHRAEVIAHVYEKADDLKKIEIIHKKKKADAQAAPAPQA